MERKHRVRVLGAGVLAALLVAGGMSAANASDSGAKSVPILARQVSQAKPLNLPGGMGKITSNTWRSGESYSGNTVQWNYQVSAVYSGSKDVQRIRTTWTGSASMRNGGSLSLGLSTTGVTVGGSSSWQSVSQTGYWENTKGQKTSSWRSNLVVSPSRDYRDGTVAVTNTALVKLKVDARTFSVTSGV